jgi:hypothetical protein
VEHDDKRRNPNFKLQLELEIHSKLRAWSPNSAYSRNHNTYNYISYT